MDMIYGRHCRCRYGDLDSFGRAGGGERVESFWELLFILFMVIRADEKMVLANTREYSVAVSVESPDVDTYRIPYPTSLDLDGTPNSNANHTHVTSLERPFTCSIPWTTLILFYSAQTSHAATLVQPDLHALFQQ
jgi:hypothetical protein